MRGLAYHGDQRKSYYASETEEQLDISYRNPDAKSVVLWDPDWRQNMVSLADNLYEEAHLNKDGASVEACLQIRREAVENTPPDHPERLTTLTKLAISLDLLSQISGELAPLKEATLWHAEALCMCPTDHADRADVISNLVSSLNRRRKMAKDSTTQDGTSDLKEEGADTEHVICAHSLKEEIAAPGVPGM